MKKFKRCVDRIDFDYYVIKGFTLDEVLRRLADHEDAEYDEMKEIVDRLKSEGYSVNDIDEDKRYTVCLEDGSVILKDNKMLKSALSKLYKFESDIEFKINQAIRFLNAYGYNVDEN